MRFTFCYRHIAPYHHAQLNKLADADVQVTVITLNDYSSAAFSDNLFSQTKYKLCVVSNDSGDWVDLDCELKKSKPDVVFVPGWGHDYALAALAWSKRAQISCIAISDTQKCDQKRNIFTEIIKKRLVKLFSAGFVAGQRSGCYINQLGIPLEKIITGCDSVDNQHFIQSADKARFSERSTRDLLDLPSKYFLLVNRLIDVKNTALVINAFSLFCIEHPQNDWFLVIVGTGPLLPELKNLANDLGVAHLVMFIGSVSYDAIPSYYALAKVFILASKSESWGLVVNEAMCAGLPVLVSDKCGCSADLVNEQINGLTFESENIHELISCMKKALSGDLVAMGKSSRDIISGWSLDNYVESIKKVAAISRLDKNGKYNLIDRVIVSIFINIYRISGRKK